MLSHTSGPWEQKADWPSLKEAHLGSAQIMEEVTIVVRNHGMWRGHVTVPRVPCSEKTTPGGGSPLHAHTGGYTRLLKFLSFGALEKTMALS